MVKASREFQVMVKPTGAACNLDCTYCYYLKKKDLYPKTESYRMPDDLLESYILQHIEACPTRLIMFSWHGGEPTLLGVDYFRRIVELQKKHQPQGRKIINGMQTNGTLLDDEWCRFLRAEGFLIGLSMDGPRELHDVHRMTKGEDSTHKQVMVAYRLLNTHRVPHDILCVVNRRNARQPAAVYRFFKDLGVKSLQFLPLVMRLGEHGVTADSVPAEAYGDFLATVFDEWVRNDIGRLVVQNFDEAERPFLGVDHALCIHRKTCGDVVVVEHNGDLYACDHFVDAAHRIGNIRQTPLVELLEDPALTAFGRDKWDALPPYCVDCEILKSCNGGCQKDRFILTPDGAPGLNYLCAGYKIFFTRSAPYLRRMAALRRARKPLEGLMSELRAEATKATGQVGRNDPCPCGSGRKYKKCCLGKMSFASG